MNQRGGVQHLDNKRNLLCAYLCTHDFSLFTYQKYSYGVCLCLYNVTLQ